MMPRDLEREHALMLANLTATQNRCTSLINETRAWKARAKDLEAELLRAIQVAFDPSPTIRSQAFSRALIVLSEGDPRPPAPAPAAPDPLGAVERGRGDAGAGAQARGTGEVGDA